MTFSKMSTTKLCVIFLVILNVTHLTSSHSLVDDFLCSDEYCHNYTKQFKCSRARSLDPVKLNYPSPTPCNCCNLQIKKLEITDDCLIGSPNAIFPGIVCGDRLVCSVRDGQMGNARCQRMETSCVSIMDHWQEEMDAGRLGKLMERPQCDVDGYFGAVKCVPGLYCYCQDENGKRLFGEDLYKNGVEKPQMDCGCSRALATLEKRQTLAAGWFKTMRCSATGDYHGIQCFGNKCACVDATSGLNDEQDNYFTRDDADDHAVCLLGEFQSGDLIDGPCTRKVQDQLDEVTRVKSDGIDLIGLEWPVCDWDGFYGKVQETYTTKFCVDIFGETIDSYVVDKSNGDLAQGMNCHCARLVWQMKRANITSMRPACCANGNFNAVQCRRNECWCVDGNGNQLTVEEEWSDRAKLPCYNVQCAL